MKIKLFIIYFGLTLASAGGAKIYYDNVYKIAERDEYVGIQKDILTLKKFQWENTPLNLVFEEMTEHFGVNFEIANTQILKYSNTQILNCPFVGTFQDTDSTTIKLAFILETLKFSTGLEIKEKDSITFIVDGKGCEEK